MTAYRHGEGVRAARGSWGLRQQGRPCGTRGFEMSRSVAHPSRSLTEWDAIDDPTLANVVSDQWRTALCRPRTPVQLAGGLRPRRGDLGQPADSSCGRRPPRTASPPRSTSTRTTPTAGARHVRTRELPHASDCAVRRHRPPPVPFFVSPRRSCAAQALLGGIGADSRRPCQSWRSDFFEVEVGMDDAQTASSPTRDEPHAVADKLPPPASSSAAPTTAMSPTCSGRHDVARAPEALIRRRRDDRRWTVRNSPPSGPSRSDVHAAPSRTADRAGSQRSSSCGAIDLVRARLEATGRASGIRPKSCTGGPTCSIIRSGTRCPRLVSGLGRQTPGAAGLSGPQSGWSGTT